jgi:carboxyl-terminal processing protease
MLTSQAAAALPLLVDAAVKGTVVLLLALALARSLRRSSAAVRDLVWAMTMVALLGVPFFYLLPAWEVPLVVPGMNVAQPTENADLKKYLIVLEEPAKLAGLSPAPIEEAKAEPMLVANGDTTASTTLPSRENPADVSTEARSASVAAWIVVAWFSGALLSLLWLAGGWLSVARVARDCRHVRNGSLQEMLALVAHELEIRRHVNLLLSNRRTIPMTWGLWRPVVLLPQDAHAWSAARLRMVLIHELGHVKRWDCLAQILGHLARGFYWFHPLAWLAVRRLRIEQEQACDDLVLDSGSTAADYAEHLLAVTAGLPAGFRTAPVALGMGRAENLRRRLTCLLDGSRDHRPVRRHALLWASALTLALIMSLGMVAFSLVPSTVHADEPQSKAALFVAPPADPAAAPGAPGEQGEQANSEKDSALLKKLNEVWDKLAKHYVAPLDDKALAEQALKGLLKGLKDPYTDYLSTEDLNSYDSQVKGKLSGIGAQLQVVNDRLTVTTPLEDSPALKAGLRPGDFIEAIDGKPTRGLAMNDAVERIVGPAGSVVKLKIVHPEGVVEELLITRGEIRLRTVAGFRRGPDGRWQFLLDPDHKIGYMHVHQFARSTAAEVREAIQGLQKEGLKGLILDLRFCPGGLLDQALEACKLFVAKGVILTTRGPAKEEMVFKADGKTTLGDFPVLLLINEQTASAAEIVAGSLRDHERAVLLGTRSYGKGSVQTLVMLDEGGALKVTTAYHYLPGGRNIQKRPGAKTWGVDPSDGFYLPVTSAQAEALRQDAQKRALLELKTEGGPKRPPLTPKMIEENHADPQLAAALRSMTARLTGGEFLKVGKDNGILLDQAVRLEEMRQRREDLLRSMNQLEREMAELQQGVGKEKAPK